MKKFFTFLLYLFVVILIAAVVIGIEILLNRPLQEAFIIIGVILAAWLLIVLIRKLIIRYRAKAQVERVIKRENEIVDPHLGKSPKELAKDLRRKWNSAIKALRSSHLRMKGDPLYVLPWYMVFGKPASGKSTALKNAKLLSPAMELSEHEDGSTLNLDWWLYDQAIVIDTAGRYAIPDNDKRDKKEWGVLLKMLSRHKQKEPLNGLVLVVSAERLLNDTKEQLMEEGQKIRSGLNELMEKLEINMPVYLMITKCDLVEQFSNWCKYLPDESLSQVMGFMCTEEVTDIDATLDKAFDKVLDRLKELRLMMMERSDNPDDSLIELPIHLEKLRNGLHAFATTALKSNLYQETPNFRGLYFSSSQQLDASTGALNNHGIFLHHLFTRVMPPDRSILSTLPNAERIRRAIRNYGLSASGAFVAIVLLLITSAFVADVKPLKTVLTTNEEIQLNQKSPRDEIIALYRLSVLIDNVEKVENQWSVPWYAFFGPSPHRKQMTEMFVNTFHSQVLVPMDKSMNLLAGNVSDENTANLVSGLVRRINLINARLSKSDEEDAFANAKNLPDGYLSSINPDIGNDASQLFAILYRKYVKYETVTSDLNDEKLALQSSLAKSLSSNHGGYEWLIKWANNQDFPDINLTDFWSGSVTLDNPVKVPAAYTVQGKEFLDGFIKELELASSDSTSISAIKKDFMAYYSRNYLKAWKNFADNFDSGMKMLRGQKEWSTALESMAGRDNPYFALMDEIKNQTADVTSEGVFPSDENIAYFTEIQDYIGEDTSGGKGLSSKQKKKFAKLGLRLLKKFGKVGKSLAKAGKTGMKLTKGSKKKEGGEEVNEDDVLKSASQDYKDYKKALKDLSFNSDSTKLSYNSTVSAFTNPDDLSAGDGSGAAAWTAIYKLQKDVGKPDPSSKLFWDLYTGPARLAYSYMSKEAGCYLQDSWNNDVLAQIAGVSQDKLGETLIGDKGVVWKYVDNTAAPFLKKRYLKGYIPAIVNGKSLPWSEDFMSFINHADEGRNIVGNDFTVKISALPTGINQGAEISPYATYLDLHCADGVQSLTNYNYSASTDFKWSLEKCGDTSLRIQVGEITLRKDYPGRKGFSKFLADFRDGRKIFTPDDFPGKASQLRNENVTGIDVNYQISGQEPVVKVLTAVPLTPPDEAIACWSK